MSPTSQLPVGAIAASPEKKSALPLSYVTPVGVGGRKPALFHFCHTVSAATTSGESHEVLPSRRSRMPDEPTRLLSAMLNQWLPSQPSLSAAANGILPAALIF